jgi:hypothetical protein
MRILETITCVYDTCHVGDKLKGICTQRYWIVVDKLSEHVILNEFDKDGDIVCVGLLSDRNIHKSVHKIDGFPWEEQKS